MRNGYKILPTRIYCGNCSRDFYVGLELESPLETVLEYGGICPGCKNMLNFKIEAVKITPIEQA